MTVVAHIDFETRSTVDLKKAGVHRYAEDATTEILCLAYCLGDGAIQSWSPGEPAPADLLKFIREGGVVAAHNMQFDRTIWNAKTPVDWPRIAIEQTDCTMARAQALGLPASLDQLCRALDLKVQKDREGSTLMLRMCKPKREGGWLDTPELRARLRKYCVTDVETEREVDRVLPTLTASERRIYHLDQTINDRGVKIDRALAASAAKVVAEARRRADDRMWVLTDGAVAKCTEAARLVAWLRSRGIPCESVAKGEIEELVLAGEVFGDDDAIEAIRLRRSTSRTSTDKFTAMLTAASADDRVRGTLAYHSAHTGRWAGRLIQPQNLPRVDPDRDLPDVETALRVLGWDRAADETCTALETLTGDVMGTLSKCLRAALIADQKRKFTGGDFSNIEGRINAWIAGEAWKLRAFEEYDAGIGPDLYKLAYARAFDVSVDAVTKPDRQIGKVMELALGYQGGVGAFQTMAAVYNVRVSDERAEELKAAWRAANPQIVQSWWAMQDAAIAAVGSPGAKMPILDGRVVFIAANGFLFCRVPSGRVIAFAQPRLIVTRDKFDRPRYQVEYDGLDSQTKNWGPQRLYGGKLCNNIVQGTARDIMAEAMLRAEAAGYSTVLTVHDELLAEVPDTGRHTAEEFCRVMSELPAWASGLPVAAASWEDNRYTK